MVEQPFALGAWKWKEKEEMETRLLVTQGPPTRFQLSRFHFFPDTATPDKPSVRLSWENKQADHGFVHDGSAVGTQDHVLCRNTHLVISQCLRNIKCHHWL